MTVPSDNNVSLFDILERRLARGVVPENYVSPFEKMTVAASTTRQVDAYQNAFEDALRSGIGAQLRAQYIHKINATLNRQPCTGTRAWSVFISYASGDAETAAELAAFLEAAGCAPWWSQHLRAGEHFRDAIIEALDAADAVVVVWSAASIGSKLVAEEAARAAGQGKLVPVRFADLDPKAIPQSFGTFHTLVLEDRAGMMHAIKRRSQPLA